MENKIAIQLLIEEDLLRQALEEAQKTRKPVGEILNENVRKSFEKNGSSHVASDAEQILRAAVDRARSLPSKEEFSLGQLCPPSDWRRLSSGERKSLGKRFRKIVEDPKSPIARHVRKSADNQAIYQRI